MENHSKKNSFVKKFMSVFLSLAVMVGVVSASGLTASAEDSNQKITDSATGLVYTIDGNNATINWFYAPNGFNGNLVIPETLGGKTVNQISCHFWDSGNIITSVTIPSSVTTIEGSLRNYESKLEQIIVSPANTVYSSRDGVLYSKDGKTLLEYPVEKLGDINIPADVTTIGEDAFAYITRKFSIVIPDNITSIGDNAFHDCDGLTNIKLSKNITSIGVNTFVYCTNLKSVEIPDKVTSIASFAFWGCEDLTSVALSNHIESIGQEAFIGCVSLANITIPSSVTFIDESAFSECTNLSNVTFNGKNIKIGKSAFSIENKDATITFNVPLGAKAYYEGLLTNDVLNGTKAKVVEAAPATPANSAPATATSSAPATLKDSASGATVVGVNGTVLGANTTLSVTPITDAQKMQKASGFLITAAGKNAALTGAQLKALYQINLNQNGVTIEPNGKVRVTMPLPASLKGLKNLNMVRFNDDGTVTLMNAVSDGTTITFETDHFSTYGIVETQPAAAKSATKNSATGDNSPIMPLAILTFAAASAFVVAKKKSCKVR